MKNDSNPIIRSEEVTIDMHICAALSESRSSGEIYFAAIAPDMELTVITLDEAPDILPCFDEDDAYLNIPDSSLLLSYNPAQVLFSTNCPNNIVLFACCRLTGFLGRISPCFQYRVRSLGRDRFRFISPYTTARLDKRQKIFSHTDIVLHSANTSEIQATKKPHNYHKIAVWQKDD